MAPWAERRPPPGSGPAPALILLPRPGHRQKGRRRRARQRPLSRREKLRGRQPDVSRWPRRGRAQAGPGRGGRGPPPPEVGEDRAHHRGIRHRGDDAQPAATAGKTREKRPERRSSISSTRAWPMPPTCRLSSSRRTGMSRAPPSSPCTYSSTRSTRRWRTTSTTWPSAWCSSAAPRTGRRARSPRARPCRNTRR
jgi:hypothetical protein